MSPRVEMYSLCCLPIKLSFACSLSASFPFMLFSLKCPILAFKNMTWEIGIVDYDN